MRPGFLSLEIMMSKLQDRIKIKVLFPVLELNFGTQFPTNFVNSPKDLLKNIFMTYCSLQWKQRIIMLKHPFCYKKSQNLLPRRNAQII